MKLRLVAVGTRMPRWVDDAFADYASRLPRELRLELVEIPVETRGKNADVARLRKLEGERMLRSLHERDTVIAFDERGESRSTLEWAQALKGWMQQGDDVALLVGGPDGLSPDARSRARHAWSLSPLTLPHGLVRVLVAEQLYRAWSVLANHPYHRA